MDGLNYSDAFQYDDSQVLERGVIGSILIDSACLPDILDIVAADDFQNAIHRKIYGVASSMFAAGRPVDAVTIRDEMDRAGDRHGDELYIGLMNEILTAAHAGDYAKRLRSAADIRKAALIVNAAFEKGGDAGTVISEIIDGLYRIERRNVKGKAKTLKDIAVKFIDWLHSKDDPAIKTGFPRLDNMLNGFHSGDLIVVGARPGVGKSALAAELSFKLAAKGMKTVLFSCEMSGIQLFQRLIANHGGIALDGIVSRAVANSSESGRVTRAVSEIAMNPMLIYDEPGITTADVRRTLQTERDIGLVAVDYAQLMTPMEKSENRQLEVAKISRDFKILAKEFNIPILLLSQLNRDKDETDEPSLRDLRDSGAIEQDADTIIFLWNLGQLGEGRKKIGVKVAKNRMGKTGVVVMYFNGEFMRFEETVENYKSKKQGRGRKFAPSYDDDLPDDWR